MSDKKKIEFSPSASLKAIEEFSGNKEELAKLFIELTEGIFNQAKLNADLEAENCKLRERIEKIDTIAARSMCPEEYDSFLYAYNLSAQDTLNGDKDE